MAIGGQPAASSFAILTDEATDRDELDRARFVGTLADVFTAAATPLVVAVYGSWGSGKTSMMLQLRRRLEPSRRAPRRAATVWFDPWELSAADDNPAIALLHAVVNDLGLGRDKRMRRALLSIARAVSDELRLPYVGLTVGRIRRVGQELAQQDFERRSERARLRTKFVEVIEVARMRDPKLPLVVFIDDLDRCKPAKAVAVLEALKLYLNLPGCIFVLGVDRQQLETAIASEYEDLEIAKESYLEKIVQLPFTIPALDQDATLGYVKRNLPTELQSCREMLAAAAPDNPRQLKRMINSLLVHDRLAQGAHFAEGQQYREQVMCALILIQNVAPELYRRLRQTPADAPAVLSSGAGTASPEWLAIALTGSDARVGLSRALTHVGLVDGNLDVAPYLTLSEQVGDQVSFGDPSDPSPEGGAFSHAGDAERTSQRAADEDAEQASDEQPGAGGRARRGRRKRDDLGGKLAPFYPRYPPDPYKGHVPD